MLNFRDFMKSKENAGNNETKNNQQQASAQNVNNDQLKQAQDIYSKYSGLGENDLMNELVNAIKEQKKNNNYNKDQILNQINMMSGYFSNEQIEKLKAILNAADQK